MTTKRDYERFDPEKLYTVGCKAAEQDSVNDQEVAALTIGAFVCFWLKEISEELASIREAAEDGK